MSEYISKEDMALINAAKAKVEIAVLQAEKAAANAKIVDYEHRSLVQHIFIKYGLTFADRINDGDGLIVREKTEEQTKEAIQQTA
jgi:hypothetical protein